MMHNRTLKVLIPVVFLIVPIHANWKMTQLDVVTPSGSLLYDSLQRTSTIVKYPGFFIDTSDFKAVTGFIDNEENGNDYSGYPLVQYDRRDNLFTNMTPYISAQKSFSNFSSGVYLGNLSVGSNIHNALSIADSINSFDKSGVKLNGALWIVPKLKFIKGLSMWAEGDHQTRKVHITDIDGWKRVHTLYKYRRTFGNGLLSGTFSFIENRYWILRAGYGNDVVGSEEQRNDTMVFSDNNYITSFENIDNSFEKSNSVMEIGHILKFNDGNMGLFAGATRTNIDYGENEKDSSRLYVNAFISKGIEVQRIFLQIGADFTYSGTFYNESYHRTGYLRLLKKYKVHRMSHLVNMDVPFCGVVSIGDKFKLISGIDFAYTFKRSNYDFTNGTKNISGFSSIDCILSPLNVQYAPQPNTLISISPKIDKEILIGSFEIRHTF